MNRSSVRVRFSAPKKLSPPGKAGFFRYRLNEWGIKRVSDRLKTIPRNDPRFTGCKRTCNPWHSVSVMVYSPGVRNRGASGRTLVSIGPPQDVSLWRNSGSWGDQKNPHPSGRG